LKNRKKSSGLQAQKNTSTPAKDFLTGPGAQNFENFQKIEKKGQKRGFLAIEINDKHFLEKKRRFLRIYAHVEISYPTVFYAKYLIGYSGQKPDFDPFFVIISVDVFSGLAPLIFFSIFLP
jgi:hypothetical protein